jgi:hypothetical protein
MEGEYRGKTYRQFEGLDNEDRWMWFLRLLQSMGFDIAQIDSFEEDIPVIMEQIAKDRPVCRVTLKSSGDFQNLRVRRLADEDEVEELESAEDDDAPVAKKKSKVADPEEEEEEAEEEEAEEEEAEEGEEAEEEGEEEEAEEGEEEEAEEGEEEESEGEEIAVMVGGTVKVQTAGGEKTGKIVEILEDAEKIRLELKNGKVLRVPFDAILEVVDAPAAPKKAPKPVAKKVTPKPVAKKKALKRKR